MPGLNINRKHLEEFHLEELHDCRYYYGALTSEEATSLLISERFGTYLVRDGPSNTNTPLILSIKTNGVFHCPMITDKLKKSLKILFNQADIRPKLLPGLPMSIGPFEDFFPPNNSIIGEVLSTIYRFNVSLSYPLRRNCVLPLCDITRKRILSLMEEKDVEELHIPRHLKTFIQTWRTCDQDLDRFPW